MDMNEDTKKLDLNDDPTITIDPVGDAPTVVFPAVRTAASDSSRADTMAYPYGYESNAYNSGFGSPAVPPDAPVDPASHYEKDSHGHALKTAGIITAIVFLVFLFLLPSITTTLYGPNASLSSITEEQNKGKIPAQVQDESKQKAESESAGTDENNNDYKTVDVTRIVGEKWSNARKILQARGASDDDYILLTENGKTPVNWSNWTVVKTGVDVSGKTTITLKQDVDTSEQLKDAGDTAKSKFKSMTDSVVGSLDSDKSTTK